MRRQLREDTASESMVEDEILMLTFDTSFDEFNEMVIQYGCAGAAATNSYSLTPTSTIIGLIVFVASADLALFAPAFSLAPLFAMINNVFEIRIDAVKFCVSR